MMCLRPNLPSSQLRTVRRETHACILAGRRLHTSPTCILYWQRTRCGCGTPRCRVHYPAEAHGNPTAHTRARAREPGWIAEGLTQPPNCPGAGGNRPSGSATDVDTTVAPRPKGGEEQTAAVTQFSPGDGAVCMVWWRTESSVARWRGYYHTIPSAGNTALSGAPAPKWRSMRI